MNCQETKYFCLNPLCGQKEERVFKEDDEHYSSQKCLKWIISQRINDIESQAIFIHPEDGYLLNPSLNTLECILSLRNSKPQFEKRLQQIFQQVKISFQHTLSILENLIIMKLDKLFQPIDHFNGELNQFIKLNKDKPPFQVSLNINQLLLSENLKHFTQQCPTNIMKKTNIEETFGRIRKMTESFIDELICKQDQPLLDITIGKKEITLLRQYLTDPNENNHEKIVKFSSLLRIPANKIFEKDGKKYQSMILKCPLCSFSISTSIKKKQKCKLCEQLWKPMNQHLICCHLEEVGYNYEIFVSKINHYQTTYNNIKYLLNAYSYEGLQLILYSGRKFYAFNCSNYKKLQVQVLLTNELPQLSIRYLSVANFQQFLVLLGLLLSNINSLNQNMKGKKKFINVFGSKLELQKCKKLYEKYQQNNIYYFDCLQQKGEDNLRSLDQSGTSPRCLMEQYEMDDSTQFVI